MSTEATSFAHSDATRAFLATDERKLLINNEWVAASGSELIATVDPATNDTLAHIAEDIRAGMVWINCHSMWDASLPIGGFKQSGWGRESGQQAVDNYLTEKTVCAVI